MLLTGVMSIFGRIFFRGISTEISRLKKAIKAELTKIRQESEEHLQAINENTNEISANYEYISELESKLEKVSERVDQLQLSLQGSSKTTLLTRTNPTRDKFSVKKLNRREQDVFLVIYTLEEEKGSLTYGDIAKKLNISIQLAGEYVTSLIEKGVPIIKRYMNSKPYLKLDPEFKTLQTKENILQLSLEEFGF